jgi:N-acetylglucosaminyldiphosphoundecaprenol N-acetyl-beta-D-mannosaminyltransferase
VDAPSDSAAGSTAPAPPAPPAPPAGWQSLRVLGVRVDAVTQDQVLAAMAGWIAGAGERGPAGLPRRTRQVVTLNPEIVMAARGDPQLRALIDDADLVVPDGIGVVWAARLRGRRFPERVTGVDTVEALARLAARRGWRLFLLGAAPGVAEAAAANLVARFPGLTVAGTYSGAPDPAWDDVSTGLVRASAADIVCVAYGAPAQERWIARNRDRLGAGAALGVGGALDFLAGRVPRAPRWAQRAGLEWAYRLWRQPWRWRRMRALPGFSVAVLRETVRESVRSVRCVLRGVIRDTVHRVRSRGECTG